MGCENIGKTSGMAERVQQGLYSSSPGKKGTALKIAWLQPLEIKKAMDGRI
jgi:hypothetical protein